MYQLKLLLQPTDLVVDFGLLVLIWMVQVIIYPSFKYYGAENLKRWHGKYTRRISFIVQPLMIAQVILNISRCIQDPSKSHIVACLAIAGIWLITFLVFVPYHKRINSGNLENDLLRKLVNWNWMRTALWTFVFLLNLVYLY